jgi:hypothetical protein
MNLDYPTIITVGVLVVFLLVLSMIPSFLGREGFTSGLRPNLVSGKATPIGEYDGKTLPSDKLTLGDAKEGPVLTVRTGGSAFAPAVTPTIDPKNNQLHYFTRNETSQDSKACLLSPYSTSTGCVIPTKQDVLDHETRGGNRAVDMYI